MRSRSDRYKENVNAEKPRLTRTNKNKYLYDDMNSKIGLEVVDLNDSKELNLSSIMPKEEKENSIDPENIIPPQIEEDQQPKVFDINSVLEEAKKNRTDVDELEKKRKIKNEDYNVLNNLNKKYITQKDKLHKELEEEGLQELIDTITSNTLSNDLKNAELFSDLMPTSTKLELEKMSDKTGEMEEVQKSEDGHLVNSFYTKSMDLSEQDFEMSEEFVEKRSIKKTLLIIFVIIILLAIIGVVGYFLLRSKNII